MEFFLSGDTMDNPIEIIAELFGSLEDAGAKFSVLFVAFMIMAALTIYFVLSNPRLNKALKK